MRKKIAVVVSNIDKSLGFEWFLAGINKEKYIITFIVLHHSSSKLYAFAKSQDYDAHLLEYRGKHDLLIVLIKLVKIFISNRFDIVHCHLFEGSLLGLLAAWIARVPTRIYTRHHSTIHHQYFPKGVKYDLFINNLATKIIAVSKNVFTTLTKLEGVPPSKIIIVNHGFDLSMFNNKNSDTISSLKAKYQILDGQVVVGVISRFVVEKGIQYIIPAFYNLLQDYPTAKLVLANAQGAYAHEIDQLLLKLPNDSFSKITFENDVVSLYSCFDIFVHVPIDESEAFGQTYIEALAVGIPSIFTLSGIAPEFIKDQENALVVPFKDSEAIASALKILVQDKPLRNRLVTNGKEAVKHSFSVQRMMENLEKVYDNT